MRRDGIIAIPRANVAVTAVVGIMGGTLVLVRLIAEEVMGRDDYLEVHSLMTDLDIYS